MCSRAAAAWACHVMWLSVRHIDWPCSFSQEFHAGCVTQSPGLCDGEVAGLGVRVK
jgi:hypothetical protein